MRLKPIKKRLGDILVDVGIITPEQLNNALEIQKRGGGKLGEILAQMGVINEEVMLAFIGKQCGASFISLSEYGEIPPDIIRTIPESIARQQNLIPISKDGNVLTVAMSDPFNIFALDDIKVMTGHDVQVVIASEPEIRSAVSKYYFSPSLIDSAQKETGSPEEQTASLISKADAAHATEIHFEPQSDSVRVRFRIDGTLHEQAPVSEKMKTGISKKLKLLAGLDPAQSSTPSQGHAKIKTSDGKDVHIKLSAVPTILGERLMVRLLDPALPGLDFAKLGFEPESLALYRKAVEAPSGMILLTGPINSGKTTTLYSTLNYLNHPEHNIITIEDPVEYLIPGLTQIKVSQEHLFGFPRALAHAIDHKPDIIMVGELRDHETAEIALDAAVAGHLVLSTLFSSRSIETVTQLYNMGIEPYKIASALKMIACQRLMRTICPECKTSYRLSAAILRSIGIAPSSDDKSSGEISLWRGAGCKSCNNTGYSGQTAVYEVIALEEKSLSLIAQKAPESVLEESFYAKGSLTLKEASWRKVASGISTIEEMMRVNSGNNMRGALKC